MKIRKIVGKALLHVLGFAYFLFFFSELFMVSAAAYIDPALTAMLIQIAAGIFITLGVVFGVFRKKVILFFKNIGVKRTQRKIEKQVSRQSGEVTNS